MCEFCVTEGLVTLGGYLAEEICKLFFLRISCADRQSRLLQSLTQVIADFFPVCPESGRFFVFLTLTFIRAWKKIWEQS